MHGIYNCDCQSLSEHQYTWKQHQIENFGHWIEVWITLHSGPTFSVVSQSTTLQIQYFARRQY